MKILLKSCKTLFVIFAFAIFMSAPLMALGADASPFAIKIVCSIETQGAGQTLVIDWQIKANRSGMTLRSIQGLNIAFDNTMLQLMKWNGSASVEDSALASLLRPIPGAFGTGAYAYNMIVYAAKNQSGNTGYLSIALGDPYETYSCPANQFVSLAKVRMAFRQTAQQDGLSQNIIREMSAPELLAMNQTYGILINTNENGSKSYWRIHQANGQLIADDTLPAPEIVIPSAMSTPAPSPTPTPALLPTPSPTPTKAPTPTPPAISTPSSTPTPAPTTTPAPTPTPSIIPGGPTPPGGATGPGGATSPGGSTSPGSGSSQTNNQQNNLSTPIPSAPPTGNNLPDPSNPQGNPDSQSPGTANTAGSANTANSAGTANSANPAGGADPNNNINPFSPFNPFTEIFETNWFYDAVLFCYNQGLMLGTSETTFGPDIPVTRGMIVTILGRQSGADISQYSASDFIDVRPGEYYARFIEWARQSGIVEGVGANMFAPDAPVTRQDLAVLFSRFAAATDMELPVLLVYNGFADGNEISPYAKEAVAQLYKAGIISGKPGNIFEPSGAATRAEVAAILYRYLTSI